MDAQYPFASREDIWRVHEEVKDLFATQMEHGERLSKLERRKDEDTRIKNLWEPSFPSPAEPFKGFDQGHQHGISNNLHLENEEDPKRGASRANSVRFDESSMHGNYSQANRSASELVPVRTGSGLGSHPLTERSLSHRSDGRQSSSGQSHRTYSLGLENSKVEGSSTPALAARSAITPPPGLFILGPVPSIIRCWLTTTFSNDSLLYAVICTGAYSSTITSRMIEKLGLGDGVEEEEDGVQSIKLPFYLPEASVYQSSSRSGSPAPQVPALTVRFLVRETETSDDKVIQIFLGSDVLRAHNADILFSQDKILIVDDERNRISVPLVRPEDHDAFRTLSTGPHQGTVPSSHEPDEKDTPLATSNAERTVGSASYGASPAPRKFPKSTLTLRTSTDSFESHNIKPRSAHFADESDGNTSDHIQPKSAIAIDRPSSKAEGAGVWGPWRRDTSQSASTATTPKTETSPYLAAASQRPTRARNMKVLKPSRQPSGSVTAPQSSVEPSAPFRKGDFAAHRTVQSSSSTTGDEESMNHTERPRASADGGSRASKPRTANPVGGASAFGWLNSKQGGTAPE